MDLVDEDHRCFGFVDDAGEFAQRLAHESGLQTHVAVAHVAINFGLRYERRNRVDNDEVDGVWRHQRRDFEACSPLSGWLTRRLSVSTPSFLA